MEHQGKACVIFDYTSFLGASCNKKWTFLEAMSSFAPIFSVAWKDTVNRGLSPEDELWDLAMKSMSAGRSDESNLRTLVKLAKDQGIAELKLVMPYELDNQQLERIQTKSKVIIKRLQQDELSITF